MENPFKKLFGARLASAEEAPESLEQERVVDTDFEVRDDGVYVRDVFDDGRVGEWTMLYDNPSDSEGARAKYKQYRRDKGIVEESDLNM